MRLPLLRTFMDAFKAPTLRAPSLIDTLIPSASGSTLTRKQQKIRKKMNRISKASRRRNRHN